MDEVYLCSLMVGVFLEFFLLFVFLIGGGNGENREIVLFDEKGKVDGIVNEIVRDVFDVGGVDCLEVVMEKMLLKMICMVLVDFICRFFIFYKCEGR